MCASPINRIFKIYLWEPNGLLKLRAETLVLKVNFSFIRVGYLGTQRAKSWWEENMAILTIQTIRAKLPNLRAARAEWQGEKRRDESRRGLCGEGTDLKILSQHWQQSSLHIGHAKELLSKLSLPQEAIRAPFPLVQHIIPGKELRILVLFKGCAPPASQLSKSDVQPYLVWNTDVIDLL